MHSTTSFLRSVIVLFVVLGLYIPQNIHAAGNTDGVTVVSSTQHELVVSYKPVVTSLNPVRTNDGRTALLPSIKGASDEFATAGAPMRILKNINVTVPSADGFMLDNVSVSGVAVASGMISPVPTLVRNGEFNDQVNIINDELYKSSQSPGWAELTYTGLGRNRHLARLQLTAARYNPTTNSIEIPEEILVRIVFNPIADNNQNHAANDDFSVPYSINQDQTRGWTAGSSRTNKFYRKSSEKIAVLSGGTWLKVKIDEEGVYRMDASFLLSNGVSIPREDVPTIKMFTNGGRDMGESVAEAVNRQLNEQPLIVETNGSGDLGSIIFYGSPAKGFLYDGRDFKHYLNHYSNSNYYLLTWGGTPGKRATAQEPPAAPEVLSPSTYMEMTFFEEELRNAFANSYGSGRTWFGGNIFPKTYSQTLYNLDRTGEGGNVIFKVAVAHNSTSEGKFSVKEASNPVMEISLSGFSDTYTDAVRRIQSATLEPSKISADGLCMTTLSYNNPKNQNATSYLDWIEVSYPRSFIAIDNETGFFTDPSKPGVTKYTVNGFSGTIYGFDVTDPARPEMIGNTSVTGGMFIFKTEVVQNKPKRFFLSSKMRTPGLEKTQMAGLRDRQDNAEMIVITHNDLMESANAYRDYRLGHDNMKVAVIRTEDIYTEFGSGIADPTAVRDFIAYAFGHWDVKPKYVLLWGDGHYDYKDITKSGKPNYVLPYESNDEGMDTFNETRSYTSDDYFAIVSGNDDREDLAIGRLPIDSPKNGFVMLDKIKKYENESSPDLWRTVVTLMADDGPTTAGESDGFTHGRQSEEISRDFVPEDFQQKKIYLVEYPTENVTGGRRKPAATQDLVNTVNTTGTLILNWVGHGSPRVWAHEEAFERDRTSALMNNPAKLFFVSAATCDFGRFDMTDVRCGSEELVMREHGGAIASFAATRVVYSSENASINKALFAALFRRDSANGYNYPRLGDAMFQLKQDNYGDNDRRYYLLGDPALKLLMPDNIISIDSLNGMNLAGNNDTAFIKALSTVRISGTIINRSTKVLDESFNGTAVVNMFDSDINNVIKDNEGVEHYILNRGGALNRSSYTVTSGRFTATFVIPKDISFSGERGRLFAYAYSTDKRFAKGSTRSFVLDGVDSVTSVDPNGPTISVFLDSREFVACQTVSRNPLLIVDLEDESGINTTGMGIGHRIEAWIDDNPNSIDLTEKFTTSLENSKIGTAEEMIFGLLPGEHTVKIRAWDVFNNFSTAESCFRIAGDKDGVVVEEMYNVPNPFHETTTIRFFHNLSGTFDAGIDIFTVTGQMVRSLLSEINTLHTGEMVWDGHDQSGNLMPSGVYFYRLTIFGGGGRTQAGTLTLVR